MDERRVEIPVPGGPGVSYIVVNILGVSEKSFIGGADRKNIFPIALVAHAEGRRIETDDRAPDQLVQEVIDWGRLRIDASVVDRNNTLVGEHPDARVQLHGGIGTDNFSRQVKGDDGKVRRRVA